MERDAIKQTPQRRGDKGSVQRSLRSAGRCGPTRLPWRPLQGSTRQTPAHKMVHCVQHCITGIVAMVCTMRMRCTHATLLRTVLAFVIVCLPASSCSFVNCFSCFSATYSQQPHKALQRLQAEPTEPSVCCAVVWHIWPGQHTPTGASASEQCRTAAWLGLAWLGLAWLGLAWLGLAALLYGAA